jgi:DNA-binding transcriptional LysR family regulator
MPGNAKRGQELRVRVDGQLTFNNSYAMVDPVLNGCGIAYVPENLVERHIASGGLVLLLDEWSPLDGYYIYYPSRRQNSPAFKVIVDALRHREG